MKKLLLLLVFAGAVQVSFAQRGDLRFTGWNEFVLDFTTRSGNIKVGKIDNYRNGGKSGTLYIQVWLFSSAYTGAVQNGYKLDEITLGQLNGGYYFHSMNYSISWDQEPPAGTYTVSFLLVEYNPQPGGNYWVSDWINFDQRATIAKRESRADYLPKLNRLLNNAKGQHLGKNLGEKVYVAGQDLSTRFWVDRREGDSTQVIRQEFGYIPWGSLLSVTRYKNTRPASALEAIVLYFNEPLSYKTYVNGSYSAQRSGKTRTITMYIRKSDWYEAEELLYKIADAD